MGETVYFLTICFLIINNLFTTQRNPTSATHRSFLGKTSLYFLLISHKLMSVKRNSYTKITRHIRKLIKMSGNKINKD